MTGVQTCALPILCDYLHTDCHSVPADTEVLRGRGIGSRKRLKIDSFGKAAEVGLPAVKDKNKYGK